jgi:hypothetical protein
MTIHPWAPNWESRIVWEAQSLGFADLTDLLASMPAKTYNEVASRFENAAPIQIIAVQFMEAKAVDRVRDAAKGSLCRNVAEKLPKGWGIGKEAKFDSNLALSRWSTEIVVTGECEELEPFVEAVADALYQLPPPRGWRPQGPGDPLIKSIFDAHWPVEATP